MDPSNQNAQFLFKGILRGNIDVPDPPSRIIKLFVSSTRAEFSNERISLHEYIFLELQRHCAQLGLDLLIVDPNWQYLSSESTTTSTIQSTSPATVPTASSPSIQRTTTLKQQSVGDSSSNTTAPPASPRTTNRAASLPLTSLNDNLQITESVYIDQIVNTSKNILDPNLFSLELEEIDDCYQQSIYVFFLILIGHKYKPLVLPTSLSVEEFDSLSNCATEHELSASSILLKYYQPDTNANDRQRYKLIELKDQFSQLHNASNTIRNLNKSTNSQSSPQSSVKINLELFKFCSDLNELLKLMECSTCNHPTLSLRSSLYLQLRHAISISQQENDRVVACVRQFEDDEDNKSKIAVYFPDLFDLTTQSENGLKIILDELIYNISKSNVHYFTLPWSIFQPDRDTNNNKQNLTSTSLKVANSWQLTIPTDYSNKFTDHLFNTLKKSIEQAAKCVQAYFDYPNELFHELHSHIANCRRTAQSVQTNFLVDEILIKVQQIMKNAITDHQQATLTSSSPMLAQNVARHSPIVLVGSEGTGKSTILAQIYSQVDQWFEPEIEIVRIVRLIGQSPASCYSSELLRTLCVNISLAFGNDLLPSNINTVVDHELSSLSTWLNELLKIVESSFSDHVLIIILDDLHLIKQNFVAKSSSLLSWFPFSLPENVHIICSVDERDDTLLNVLRTRISADNFLRLQATYNEWSIMEQIISNKLISSYDRNLTSNQWRLLESQSTSFQKSTMLYLNLLVTNELKNWTSFEPNELKELKDLKDLKESKNGIGKIAQLSKEVKDMSINKEANKEQSTVDTNLLPNSIEQLLNQSLLKLEKAFGGKILAKICTYLAYTRYGLREVELIELISSEDTLQSNPIHSWLNIKHILSPFLSENYILGRPYLNWKHSNFRTEIQLRYVKSDLMRRRIHTELANAFYLGFTDILQQENSVTLHSKDRQPNTDIMREMDELWNHLVLAGDLHNLKTFTVLNIDFLMSCVMNASISYLRSILELIRGLYFDWEIELLFNMSKNCITVVSQEPIQLSIELLIWLKQFSSIGPLNLSEIKDIRESPRHLAKKAKHLERNLSLGGSPTHSQTNQSGSSNQSKDKQKQSCYSQPVRSSLLDNLIKSTLAWCVHSSSAPLLLPLNSFLNLSLPSQVAGISLKQNSISNAVLSENKQNLIFSQGKQLFIFHLATKELVRTIDAHKAPITCLTISASGRYLMSGCEDSIVNIYEVVQQDQLNIRQTKYRLSSQTSGIMSCTFTHSEELILTGSMSGSICVHLLDTGNFITKLELHRSMVTGICVNASDDVFASCSTDGIVNISSLTDFCTLNQIVLSKPILHMDISLNSTFLMLSCDDNLVYICALSTGTTVHCIEPSTKTPNTVVTNCKFSNDSCRALIGTGDGRLLIFDVHSAKLLQCHSSHSDMIIAIITYPFDNFLLTCGKTKAILWNFIARRPTGADPSAFTLSSALVPIVTNVSVVNPSTSSSITYTTAGQTSLASSNLTSSNYLPANQIGQIQSTAPLGTSTSSTNLSICKRHSIKSRNKIDNHRDLIVCLEVSKCGNYLITGSRDCFVKTWLLYTGETQYTFEGHTGAISCVAFSNNLSFCISGSDDKTIRLWALNNTMTSFVSQFTHHQFKIQSIFISADSKRVMSVDVSGIFRYWQVDSGAVLIVFQKLPSPCSQYQMVDSMLFQIAGKNNNCVRYWSVYDADIEKNVQHSEGITCYIVSFDCETLITGSMDASLKVWEIKSGKLTQVLVGHQQQITCVSVSAFASNKVLSGSTDTNLIVWDSSTGSDVIQLSAHRGAVSFCQLSLDGSTAISCGEDNRLIVWNVSDSNPGQALITMDVHCAINQFKTTHNLNHVILVPNSSSTFALFQFLRNPAQQRSLDELTPIHKTKTEVERFTSVFQNTRQLRQPWQLNRLSGKRVMKREQSFDSFYSWDHHLHRGLSVDDFSKLPAVHSLLLSPHGSTKDLLLANTISGTHTGSGIISKEEKPSVTTASVLSSSLSRPSRLVSKLMGSGKQKMLKKQQSMFACFPEHSISSNALTAIGKPQSPLASPQIGQTTHPLSSTQVTNNFQNLSSSLAKDFDSNKKKKLRNESLLLNRSLSLEENKEEGEEPVKTITRSDSHHIITEKQETNLLKVEDSSVCVIC